MNVYCVSHWHHTKCKNQTKEKWVHDIKTEPLAELLLFPVCFKTATKNGFIVALGRSCAELERKKSIILSSCFGKHEAERIMIRKK